MLIKAETKMKLCVVYELYVALREKSRFHGCYDTVSNGDNTEKTHSRIDKHVDREKYTGYRKKTL